MQKNSIWECIVSCRNILLENRVNENVIPTLKSVIVLIDEIPLEYSRNILKYCVNQAISQVFEGEFKSAGLILNLVHNLPVNKEELNAWNIDYFISMELTGFLDHFDEIMNARKISMHVFGEISKFHI